MVYAVWSVRRDVLAANPEGVREALEALVASRAWGYANPEPVIAAAQRKLARQQAKLAMQKKRELKKKKIETWLDAS